MKFFFDTYALIEIALENKKYEKFLDSDVTTLKSNLAELYYFILRKYGKDYADSLMKKFTHIVVDFPINLISESMTFRYDNKKKNFSYIDCFGYIFSQNNNRFFVTGDRAFKGMKNVELVR